MDDIREYLQQEEPDYETGLKLLREHTKNRNLVGQLQRKESSGHWAKLRYELAKVAGDTGLATLPLPLTTSEPEPLDDTPAPDPSPDLAELAQQLTPEALAEVEGITRTMADVYNRKAAASNSLGDATSRADRKHVVDEIQSLEDQYNALAEKKRLVVERGTATPPAEADELAPAPTLAELLKKRNNVRSNLSKARNRAEESKSEEKRSEYEQKVAKLAAELDVLELDVKRLQEQQ